MKHISLFSGIGGAELAAEWAGWTNVLSCDINEFGNRILEYYWPDAYHHTDIHTLNYDTINNELTRRFGDWRNEPVIITGGFPCQPFSMAGKRKGTEDNRHLWPEMRRIIREVRPEWVVGENVFGFVNWDGGMVFDQVQADLEAEGYEVQSYVLPAVSVNAPHRRDRVWVVAKNTERNGCLQREPIEEGTGVWKLGDIGTGDTIGVCGTEVAGITPDPTCERRPSRGTGGEVKGIGCGNDGESKVGCEQTKRIDGLSAFQRDATDPCNQGLQGGKNNRSIRRSGSERNEQPTRFFCTDWSDFPTQSPVCSRNDGLSRGLDGITFPKWRNESIKAYGNAWVPQVALQIFKAINEYENRN